MSYFEGQIGVEHDAKGTPTPLQFLVTLPASPIVVALSREQVKEALRRFDEMAAAAITQAPTPAEIVLLPCPFCEGPPSLITRWQDDKGVEHHMPAPLPSDDGVYVTAYVFCHECGAEAPDSDDFDKSSFCYEEADVAEIERRAALNWNLRDNRHRYLYDANAEGGRCIWPRNYEMECKCSRSATQAGYVANPKCPRHGSTVQSEYRYYHFDRYRDGKLMAEGAVAQGGL